MKGVAGAGLVVALVVIGLVTAAPAAARIKTVTVRHGPFTLDPYQVRFTSRANRWVRAPRMNGFITRMYARVVDARGRRMPVRRVMLHHVLYKNMGRSPGDRPQEAICGYTGESFYGTGEENQPLRLPPGYGYRIHKRDRWQIAWMLMNHRNSRQRAYIRYRVRIETSRRLRPVTPYWVRATGCNGATDPIFNVPGGGPPGSTVSRSTVFSLPRAGRLIAANGHVHGGSKQVTVSQPRCGDRPLMTSRPLYGLPSHPYYNVLPVLHEPGPIATSWGETATGIPLGAREPLRVTSYYDGELPHTRVMGIMHLYVDHHAPAQSSCGPLPADLQNRVLKGVRGRRNPPRITVPLTGLGPTGRARTILAPPGPLRWFDGDATVQARDTSFGTRNLSVPLGALVRWRFHDRRLHNVTLANGPRGFGSRNRRGGSYSRRFEAPGTYRVFCSLHPIDMTQRIEVRSNPQ